MYSLDVNFLKERRQSPTVSKETETVDQGEPNFTLEGNLPLIIGAVVGVTIPGALGGFWYWTTIQTSKLQEETAQLQQEFNQIKNRRDEIDQKIAEQKELLNQEQANLAGLVNVFNQVKPTSAILEDVNDRAPIDVQVNSFNQGAENQVSVNGVGASYEIVNYFYLTLKRSPFVDPESVEMAAVNKSNYTMPTVNDPEAPNVLSGEIVNYNISFQLNDTPSYQLLPILAEQGATGLVTRFRALERKGILQEVIAYNNQTTAAQEETQETQENQTE